VSSSSPILSCPELILIAYSVVTDFICAMMPVLVLWKVNMAFKLKLAVCGLMSMGLIATACAIVRASCLNTVTDDLSWAYCIAAIWGNTELHLGIIATNLSLARSIYGYFAGHEVSYSSGTRSRMHSTSRTHKSQGWIMSSDVERGESKGQHMSRGSEIDRVALRPVILKTVETEFRVSGSTECQSWLDDPSCASQEAIIK
jgi:hypothetical protein